MRLRRSTRRSPVLRRSASTITSSVRSQGASWRGSARARASELPVEVRGDEEDPGVVERADEVAAAAERDRQSALRVDIEVTAVRVLARDAPAERLAHQVLGAHA